MLRTAILHLLLAGIPRFNTISHPKALGACYKAHWRLPWPDFHWQADNSLQNTRLSPVRARPWRANKEPSRSPPGASQRLSELLRNIVKTQFTYIITFSTSSRSGITLRAPLRVVIRDAAAFANANICFRSLLFRFASPCSQI